MKLLEAVRRHLAKKIYILTENPAGKFAIVPTEPTKKMIDAGLGATAAWQDIPGSALTVNREKMRRRYKAMIGAA